MISFNPYENFNINRILLLSIGLWPYQRSKLVWCQLILVYIVLISYIMFQLTTFVTAKCTLKFFIKVFCSTIFILVRVIEYNCFWTNGQAVKHLMEQLQRICNDLQDQNEVAIIKEYGSYAKFYTAALTGVCASNMCIFSFLQIWPRIFDVILPANASKVHRTTQIMTEYFVDSERYFYLILLHMDASLCIGAIVVIATGTMFIAYFQHACGIFKIASYRIEQALSNDISQKIGPMDNVRIHKKIICAVDMHRKAMKFCTFLLSSFEKLLIFSAVASVISLSLNLFLVSQILSFGGDLEELLLCVIYIIAILLYMFFANYIGQEVIDHNNQVFATAYNVQWYVTPLHTQRMILFILQRGNKEFYLNIGKIITGSLENFASLISTSISYFTVIYSTQQ